MTVSEADVPTSVRIQMAHAHIQWVADRAQIDVLHVKGAALDESLRWEGRDGSDADVLVAARHARRFVIELQRAGWSMATDFQAGSSFEHAATLRHVEFGWADVHRYYPGLGTDADAAFDLLWSERRETDIGGRRCAVPSLPAQALVLILHAARTPGGRADLDIDRAWTSATPESKAAVLDLVERFDAHVGFAAAMGDLDRYRSHPEYLLWHVAAHGGTRIEEWRGRLRAAPTRRAALMLVLRAPLVNVQHLEVVLWRPPTKREIVAEFFARPIRGGREEIRAWRARRAGRAPS